MKNLSTMTPLRRILKERGVSKEHVIKATKISRNKFYIGLDAMNVFSNQELRAIASALGVPIKKLQ